MSCYALDDVYVCTVCTVYTLLYRLYRIAFIFLYLIETLLLLLIWATLHRFLEFIHKTFYFIRAYCLIVALYITVDSYSSAPDE